jgi:hypothetical protein
MTLQSVIMALCLICTPVSAKTETHPELECFSSPHQLYQAQGTHKWKRHKTPHGMCYHSGPKNRSGTFVHFQSPPKMVGHSVNSKSPKTISSVSGMVPKDSWGANAKRVPQTDYIFQKDFEWRTWRFGYGP